MRGEARTTVVRGGRLLDARRHRADPTDLLIRDGRIAELGPPGLEAPGEAELIDASDRLLMPGLVNAHTHGHGGLGRGAGDRWTLELLLNAGPWLSGGRTLEQKYLSTLIGALEMVRKGCTACYDLQLELPLPTVEGLEAVARAYEDAGMRAVIAPMLADRSFYEAIPGLLEALPSGLRRDVERLRLGPPEASLEVCRRLIEGWRFDRDRLRPALAPTIPLHCSDELLVASRDLARELGVGLHMHLAESKVQALAGLERYGCTLTAHLDAIGFLGPEFTGAHGVWLDADDRRRLADHGASIAHNPGSNLRLGSGLAAARELRDAGVNVGIGTDGLNCSDNQNMFEALRLASFVSRVRSHDPERWLRSEDVLEMSSAGSAHALGLGADIGRIAPGYRADIVFLDLGHVNFLPLNDPSNQLAHSEDGAAVDGVMVDGRLLLWRGHFTRIDLAGVRRRVEAAAERLRAQNRPARRLAEALEPHVTRFCIGLTAQPYGVRAMIN